MIGAGHNARCKGISIREMDESCLFTQDDYMCKIADSCSFVYEQPTRVFLYGVTASRMYVTHL